MATEVLTPQQGNANGLARADLLVEKSIYESLFGDRYTTRDPDYAQVFTLAFFVFHVSCYKIIPNILCKAGLAISTRKCGVLWYTVFDVHSLSNPNVLMVWKVKG